VLGKTTHMHLRLSLTERLFKRSFKRLLVKRSKRNQKTPKRTFWPAQPLPPPVPPPLLGQYSFGEGPPRFTIICCFCFSTNSGVWSMLDPIRPYRDLRGRLGPCRAPQGPILYHHWVDKSKIYPISDMSSVNKTVNKRQM